MPDQARDKLWRAYVTRASGLSATRATSPMAGDGIDSDNDNHHSGNNNEPIIERILELRKSLAGLLGYGSYAECSVSSKVLCLSYLSSKCTSSPEPDVGFFLHLL